MKILLATNNTHKVSEVSAILQRIQPHLEVLTPSMLEHGTIEVDESGTTLEENAYLKARAFFEHSGMPCLADDTGLEIDALGGRPGVRSARFAHEHASYDDNVALTLQLMKDIPAPERTARFRTVICYVDGARTLFAEGSCHGSISKERRGVEGFGYDPIFMPDGHSLSFAEMDPGLKNSLSHRARALEHLRTVISPYTHTDEVIDSLQHNNVHLFSPASGVHHRLLCRTAAIAATGDTEDLTHIIRSALRHGVSSEHVYETLLQTYLFAGFPVALESLSLLYDIAPDVHMHRAVEDVDLETFHTRGTVACAAIYTDVFQKMQQRLSAVSPELASWMIVEGYGKVLSRPALDLRTRELINIAILCVRNQPRQLYSHLRGACNLGATNEDIHDAIESCFGVAPLAAVRVALDVWDVVRDRRSRTVISPAS